MVDLNEGFVTITVTLTDTPWWFNVTIGVTDSVGIYYVGSLVKRNVDGLFIPSPRITKWIGKGERRQLIYFDPRGVFLVSANGLRLWIWSV